MGKYNEFHPIATLPKPAGIEPMGQPTDRPMGLARKILLYVMNVYRLSPTEFADDRSGTGAAKSAGRWNKTGTPCLYTSESRALALCECVLGASGNEKPTDLSIVTYESARRPARDGPCRKTSCRVIGPKTRPRPNVGRSATSTWKAPLLWPFGCRRALCRANTTTSLIRRPMVSTAFRSWTSGTWIWRSCS